MIRDTRFLTKWKVKGGAIKDQHIYFLHPLVWAERACGGFIRAGVIFTGLLLCIWSVDVSAGISAQARLPIYTVTDVSVDVKAETSNQARDQALNTGKTLAFKQLIRRLVPLTYEDQFPHQADVDLDPLIQGIEVLNETRSDVRYLADLTVTFKATEVRRLFKSLNLPFSEVRSKSVLVLPIMRYGTEWRLWSAPNPWRIAWQRQAQKLDLIPLVVPSGDPEDEYLITVEQARAGALDRLNILRDRYNAGDILVVEARYDDSRPTHLDISADYYGDAGLKTIQKVLNRDVTEDSRVADFLDFGVQAIYSDRVESWKMQTVRTGNEPVTTLVARVPITGFVGWLDTRQRVQESPAVSQVRILSLTQTESLIALYHYGTSDHLVTALAQDDLALNRDSGLWTLTLRK